MQLWLSDCRCFSAFCLHWGQVKHHKEPHRRPECDWKSKWFVKALSCIYLWWERNILGCLAFIHKKKCFFFMRALCPAVQCASVTRLNMPVLCRNPTYKLCVNIRVYEAVCLAQKFAINISIIILKYLSNLCSLNSALEPAEWLSSVPALDSTTFSKRQDSTLYSQTFFLGTSRPESCDVPLALTFRLVRYSRRSEARLTLGDCETEGRRACRWSFCLFLTSCLHIVLYWHVEKSSRRTFLLFKLFMVKLTRNDVTMSQRGVKLPGQWNAPWHFPLMQKAVVFFF